MKSSPAIYDFAIIGAGPTGLAAAMYAGRLGLKTVLFGKNSEFEKSIGGVITTTDVVENYPGFKHLTGDELAEKLYEHAMEYKENIDVLEERVLDVKKGPQDFMCFRLKTETGKVHQAKSVLFATGTRWRRLPMKGAKEFESRGVSYCALCDGPLFRGKTVVLVGGSDSAAKEALFLSKHAKKVTILVRGEQLRAEPVNMKLVADNPVIDVVTKINLMEIRGDKLVREVEFDRELNGSKIMKLDGVFGAIGHIPLSELAVHMGVDVDKEGHIKINRHSETNVKGLYAAGDVADTDFKQAITGVAEGVTAAHSSFTFVQANQFVCPVDDPEFV